MKKLFACLLSLVLLSACGGSDSCDSITLTLEEQDTYYTNQDIKIDISTEPSTQLTADDFSIFGGTLTVDGNVATMNYTSSGTYHIYAFKGDTKSNEITIKVTNSLASNGASSSDTTASNNTTTTDTQQTTTTTNKDDLSNWENLRDADSSKLKDPNSVASSPSQYDGTSFAMEGTIPAGSDGTYMVTSDGSQIKLSGLAMGYSGTVRVYGTLQGDTFNVYSYCAFSDQKLTSDTENKEETNTDDTQQTDTSQQTQ